MLSRSTWLFTTLAFSMACILTACGGLSTKQKTAAGNALSALRKLEAATQVKSSYEQYSQLIIDAKAQVNEAAAVLPDGELKQELNAAMDAYADAGAAWLALERNSLRDDQEPGKTLGPKYQINLQESPTAGIIAYTESLERLQNPNYESPSVKFVLNKIWTVAKSHLDRAAVAVNGR